MSEGEWKMMRIKHTTFDQLAQLGTLADSQDDVLRKLVKIALEKKASEQRQQLQKERQEEEVLA